MFTAIKAFFGGSYAYLAVGLLILALAGTVAFQWEQHKADAAQLDTEKLNTKAQAALVSQYREDLAEAQANADLQAQRARDLDKQVKERDARLKALDAEKRKISDAFDKLAGQAPQASQDCLSSDLPPSILEWLRDDGSGSDQDGSGKSPGNAH